MPASLQQMLQLDPSAFSGAFKERINCAHIGDGVSQRSRYLAAVENAESKGIAHDAVVVGIGNLNHFLHAVARDADSLHRFTAIVIERAVEIKTAFIADRLNILAR